MLKLKPSDWAAIFAIFLFAGCWAIVLLLPSSQPPIPRGVEQNSVVQKPSAHGTQQPQRYGDGTPKSPLIVQVQHSPETQAEAENDADYRERKSTDDWIVWWAGFAVWVDVIQALALVATFSIAFFVAIRQLRAYINPGTTWVKQFDLPGPIIIVVEMKNVGQTPARGFECHGTAFVAAIQLRDKRLQGPVENPAGTHSLGVLFPNDPYTVEFDCIDDLSPEVRVELKKSIPQIAVYVCGEIRYRDIFGIKRLSRFCRFIEPEDTAWLVDIREGRAAQDPNRIIRFTTANIYNDFR